jgi:hypothetical protein
MPIERTLHLQVANREGITPFHLVFDTLICGGFSGRNQEAINRHVEELRAHGLEAPRQTPIFFKITTSQAVTESTVEVLTGHTSGEVEFVLFCVAGEARWVTVGSDHTDRDLERYSIAGSKQMYPKILAPTVWPLAEVLDHWDTLILRSWVHINGERRPYQEDTLQAMLPPAELLAAATRAYGAAALQRAVVFSGTLATLSGELLFGDRFDIELLDPGLGRRIQYSYSIDLLD